MPSSDGLEDLTLCTAELEAARIPAGPNDIITIARLRAPEPKPSTSRLLTLLLFPSIQKPRITHKTRIDSRSTHGIVHSRLSPSKGSTVNGRGRAPTNAPPIRRVNNSGITNQSIAIDILSIRFLCSSSETINKTRINEHATAISRSSLGLLPGGKTCADSKIKHTPVTESATGISIPRMCGKSNSSPLVLFLIRNTVAQQKTPVETSIKGPIPSTAELRIPDSNTIMRMTIPTTGV